MEKENRVYKIRRLFRQDMDLIQTYCHSYDFLYFNPFTEDYIWQILLQGAFWAVYENEKPVAVTYILPLDSPAFTSLDASWHFADLLACSAENTLLCGYVWADDTCTDTDFYSPLTRLWSMQAARRGRSLLVHYMPAHVDFCIGRLFQNGFELKGLRGLDNLVPHYIFSKPRFFKNRKTEPCQETVACPCTDTKQISALCEKGYAGFDMDVEKNILFRR